MEFLNKIANAVVTNPLIKEYEILNIVNQVGPWVIHNAVKRSTKEKVAVFVLTKKIFDKMKKDHKDYVLDRYRTGVKLLTKVRHPKFLTVQHPLEESRECIAFATEPCSNSLDNLMKCGSLTDVEIKYGVLQLLDGISFLHNELKKCHRNLCPDSVVVNSQGLWKIFGFEFSCVSEESSEPPPSEFFFYDNEPSFSQPNLKYIAPELLSNRLSDTSADIYSLGCLIYALYNGGRSLRHAETSSMAVQRSHEISQMSGDSLGKLPPDGANEIKQMLLIACGARQKIEALQQAKFLCDIGAVSLQFLDNLMLKNRSQKIAFFKELPDILPRVPLIVKKKRVLTQLFECCKEEDLVPFILPNIFHIGMDLEAIDFQSCVFPGLKPILQITDPPHVPLIMIQNLNLIISKTKLEEAKSCVLPVLFRSLESPMIELQETVLKLIPDIVDLMDYSTLRHQLLPKIKSCCLETRLLKIRVGSLICVAKVLDSNLIDKSLVDDILLPLLEQVPSKEPAVLMSILGIYQKLLKHRLSLLDKNTLATRCIPIMFPILVSSSLNIQQFNTCMTIIRGMISKVESEQLAKLMQLEQTHAEQNQSLNFSREVVGNKQVGELVTKMDQMFSSAQPNKAMSETVQSVKNRINTPPANLLHHKTDHRVSPSKSESTFDAKMLEMVPSITSKSTHTPLSSPSLNLVKKYTNNSNLMNSSGSNSQTNDFFNKRCSTSSEPPNHAMKNNNTNNFVHHPFPYNGGMPNFIPACQNIRMSSQPQGNTMDSLDSLFGPSPVQPSLNQLVNNERTGGMLATNHQSTKQEAAVDINEIFG